MPKIFSGSALVLTYRGTFATTVRDSGIEGLIKSLSDKNRLGELKTAVIEQQ